MAHTTIDVRPDFDPENTATSQCFTVDEIYFRAVALCPHADVDDIDWLAAHRNAALKKIINSGDARALMRMEAYTRLLREYEEGIPWKKWQN